MIINQVMEVGHWFFNIVSPKILKKLFNLINM